MASISSVISLFVLLLATYCYSVPIGTEFEYSTVHSGFATDKTIVERDTLPLTSSFEETTVDPRIHIKRTGSVGHDKSDESDEFTTERSILTEDKKQKRNFFDETTSKIVERSDEIKPIDNVVVEETTIDPRIHIKRTVSVGHDKSDESDEFTTERSILTEDKKQKRNFFDETTSKIVERSEENETSDNVVAEDDKSIKVDDTLPEKREDEHIIFDITTSYVPSEESKVERNIHLDLVNTIESSTEFNARASRFMENESDVSVFTEPTSSFESLAHSTGLLHSRTIPETEEHKIEGTFEEDHTTFKPNY